MNEDDIQAALHHQEQLEQQEQAVTHHDLDLIAYRAIGVAQALRDDPSCTERIVKRLIELANEYDAMRARL